MKQKYSKLTEKVQLWFLSKKRQTLNKKQDQKMDKIEYNKSKTLVFKKARFTLGGRLIYCRATHWHWYSGTIFIYFTTPFNYQCSCHTLYCFIKTQTTQKRKPFTIFPNTMTSLLSWFAHIQSGFCSQACSNLIQIQMHYSCSFMPHCSEIFFPKYALLNFLLSVSTFIYLTFN